MQNKKALFLKSLLTKQILIYIYSYCKKKVSIRVYMTAKDGIHQISLKLL